MKCTHCGTELLPGDRFCGECGTPRPQLSSSRFAKAECRFATLHAGYQTGEMDRAVYEAELQKLIVTDSGGGCWMLGADSGEWYWYDGQQWVRRDPPLAAEAVERSPARPMPPPAVAPQQRILMPAAPPAEKELPWKWIAVGCGGLLVVVIVVVGVLAIPQLLQPRSAPLGPALVGGVAPTATLQQTQDAAPTATPVEPTIMPPATAMPPVEPTIIPLATAMPPVEPTALPTPTPQPQDTVPPLVYTEKLDSIPDLMQTDPDADLPGGGTQYCAPVSASNSLMWLAGHGFDSLSPDSANQREAQAAVARSLGSERYMDVNLESGTGPTGVLRGVSRYIKDQGYPYQSLGYQGWRKHPARFSTGVEVPEVEWFKEGLMGYSGVWLNMGWYTYDSSADQYERVGGHWVTLVGYGVDKNGNEDPSVLIIHDPGTKSGRDLVHEYVRVELIDSGRLTGEQDGLPRSAVGYYKLAGDLHVKRDADFGILDGAVVLKMGEPTATSGPAPPVGPAPPHTVLLYSDDFSDPNSGWGSKANENRERGYENGEYVVLVKQEDRLTWTWGSNATFSDFTLEADARLMEGPESARFGLIFRHQDNDNFCYVLISGEGKYTIRKRQDGQWQSVEDLHWVPLSHIEAGRATHHLKVVCLGTQFSLYVNGQHLITVQDDVLDEGKVGLIVGTVAGSDPIQVAFDNLSVYGPGQ